MRCSTTSTPAARVGQHPGAAYAAGRSTRTRSGGGQGKPFGVTCYRVGIGARCRHGASSGSVLVGSGQVGRCGFGELVAAVVVAGDPAGVKVGPDLLGQV